MPLITNTAQSELTIAGVHGQPTFSSQSSSQSAIPSPSANAILPGSNVASSGDSVGSGSARDRSSGSSNDDTTALILTADEKKE